MTTGTTPGNSPMTTDHRTTGMTTDGKSGMDQSMAIDTEKLDEDGFLLLPAFLGGDELGSVNKAVDDFYAARAERGERETGSRSQWRTFVSGPFYHEPLDDLAFRPVYAEWARRVLRTDDVRMTKYNVWRKTGGTANYDQPLHRDYRDQDLLTPLSAAAPYQIAFLTYLDDVTPGNGPTAVVPRSAAPAIAPEITELDREQRAEVYAREIRLDAAAGDTLVLPTDTWHRATDITDHGAVRTMFTVMFRRADAEWCGQRSWPSYAHENGFQRLVGRLDDAQRRLLGFPPADWSGWTDELRDALARRYPGRG
ncbi:phytanoyl-CoA dioxygenase family protein [Streptomyces pactum]|uniref:Phytanoyl-CoA dioxygenase family protein n=1 Tax=Streptomyces pactum TaxID=68249 RepID=A0ABS0NL32_9ACTN|nr:phytanoyl-CoA dioxygenase family protein [Streptomyces pactum]MBH5335918.1 phytanoyl-CoA dioxygenase family protein [Streptomyces pactum]